MTISRRDVVRLGGAALVASGVPCVAWAAAAGTRGPPANWERQPMRWFQLAFTEDDPGHFSPDFWFDYFRRIHAQGVCLSAGGGIAFYPTRIPDHGKARGLGELDPFGTMVRGSKAMGLRILARVDPHAMNSEVFARHPDWAACDASGKPRHHWTAPDLYLTCPYSGYNFEFMPKVLNEIVSNYEVDGIFGNRVNTLGVCYCANCRALYGKATGREIPLDTDPALPEAQRYWAWAEDRSLQLFDLWNRTVKAVLPNAFFISGSDRRSIVPLDGKRLYSLEPIAFADRQGRSTDQRFLQGDRVWTNGRYAKDIGSWLPGKPYGAIVSVGVEQPYRWKDSVQDEAELRIWVSSAVAQGARPWITKFNAKPLDRRWMPVIEDLYQWLYSIEPYLRNTDNLARIGLVVDQRAPALMGGQAGAADLERYRLGYYQALLESRLPFQELDAAFLDADQLRRFRLVVLPNLLMMSDAQCQAVRDYVHGGGSVVATHLTSLHGLDGRRREDFGLADLFGCSFAGKVEERMQNAYLTLRHPSPVLDGIVDDPRVIGPVKRVHVTATGPSLAPPVTLVPSYPDLPMERVYSEQPETDIPMAFCRQVRKGRVVYLPMDLDRTFAELGIGAHLRLLHAFTQWAIDEAPPVTVEGAGLYDVTVWRQERSITAHIVNYTNPMALGDAYREVVPSPPLGVRLRLPPGASVKQVRLLESGSIVPSSLQDGCVVVNVPSVRYHEIVAVDLA